MREPELDLVPRQARKVRPDLVLRPPQLHRLALAPLPTIILTHTLALIPTPYPQNHTHPYLANRIDFGLFFRDKNIFLILII